MTARPKSVRRTVGGDTKLVIVGEEGGALTSRSNVASIWVDHCGSHMSAISARALHLKLTRSEARQLRDALNKILGGAK